MANMTGTMFPGTIVPIRIERPPISADTRLRTQRPSGRAPEASFNEVKPGSGAKDSADGIGVRT